ncbi:MAG: hypothetical protein ABEK03_08070 [Candidatus Bipolaricaulia bacterium]
MLAASPPQAIGQSTDTQTLRLEAGWNLVSLRVQPADPSLDVLFDGHLDQIPMVKQERGEAYIPSQDVMEFTTWKTDEGYEVYAETAVEVDVTGTPLSPESTLVALDEGWNLIPYFPAQPQPVDSALSSVEQTLVRVENDEGDVYSPGRSIATLDSLRPGQGYKLHVSRPDTLVYESGDTSKDTIEARTLMDALSLQGLEVGQYVQVQGRDEAGDGGGGTFVVTNSACRTDGGTCFMFDEDLTQVTENPGSIDHTNLSWRSVKVRYGTDTDKDVIHMRQLNGFHEHRSREPQIWIDLKNGSKQGAGWNIINKLRKNTPGDTEYFTYKHTNSDRRLERMGVTNSVKPEWWGAPRIDPKNPKEADPELRWAMVVANRIYENNNYSWVNVEVEDGFYYQNSIPILEGVKIVGTGDLNADGFTRGELRLLPGEALYWNKKGYDQWADPDRERVHNHLLGMKPEQIRAGYAPEKFGMEKMLVNGNVPNNMQLFNNLSDYQNPIQQMQDGGSLQGFYDAAQDWPDTATPYFHDVHFKNAGGSGLSIGAAGGEADPDIDNVKIDQARRNHLIYGVSGSQPIKNVEVSGQFWGAGAILTDPRSVEGISAEYQNFTLKDIKTGQFGYNSVVSVRSGSAGVEDVLVDSFTIDLSGSSIQGYLGGKLGILNIFDDDVKFKNGTIRGYKPGNYNISNPPVVMDLGFNDANVNGVGEQAILKNTTLYDHGVEFQIAKKGGTAPRNLRLDNVTVQLASGVTRSQGSRGVFGTYKAPSTSTIPRQWRIFYKDVNYNPPAGSHTFQIFADNGDHPVDWYVSGGSVNNQPEFDELVNYSDANGRVARLFLHNFTLDFPDSGGWHGDVGPDSEGRLRNVTDSNGFVSDQVNQTYTATSTDESNGYALIPTNLLSHAYEHSVTANAGYNVTGVTVANADGTQRSDTDQKAPYLKVSVDGSITQGDTFDWTARVTPLEDYQTTGLFVAREVTNKDYASGGGPFIVDLRGVASSQESREKIVYTASSGDTSVITTNVQSDDYTLELTEQGTGTATITVTGEITGVGTTTTTFEVTVE